MVTRQKHQLLYIVDSADPKMALEEGLYNPTHSIDSSLDIAIKELDCGDNDILYIYEVKCIGEFKKQSSHTKILY